MLDQLQLIFEDNNFQASLILKSKGSLTLEKKDILRFIKEQGVLYGIDEDRVDNFIYLIKVNKIEKKAYPIAFGLKPKNGKDGEVCLPKVLEKESNIDSNAYLNAKIDYRYFIREDPICVEKDDIIGFYVPPDRGEPGINVKGEVIQPEPGKNLNIEVGNNVLFSNNRFISQIKGALKFSLVNEKFYISVENIYIVEGDVDYSTGNIEFPGTVIIKGEVKSYFLVSAEVDIYAIRVVCASLNAKGNIIIKEGIIGDKLGNKASYCKAGGIVKANYVQYSEVESADKVIVNKYILHSSVYSEKGVEVVGFPGRIIGGRIISFSGMISNVYGAKSGIQTKLIAGLHYEQFLLYEKLLSEHEKLGNEIRLLSHYLGNLSKLEWKLSQNLEELNRKRLIYKNKQLDLLKKIDLLKKNMTTYEPVKIEVNELVYPRVEINISGVSIINRQIRTKGYFILNKGKNDILFVDTI